ncbi:MAG: fused MFS/spermidine synthase [Actinobacteria bacterium]|nr:fused MFS/spermidine synthase [Actinomycetota bacterium]
MPRAAAGLLVFFTSAAVLVLEILAGRLLAPYVGVTLETYTGIIGTVLAGIALGNWLGGRAADRFDPRRLLGPIVTAGGILALLSAPAVIVIGAGISGRGGPVQIVLLAAVGFFAPAAVLSAVTPTVVKLQLDDLGETGSVVGRLAALGAAGAILGTFVTGFLLVAAWPSRTIVVVVGGALVVAGLVLWFVLRSGSRGGIVPTLLLALATGFLSIGASGPCEYESPYFCARVVEGEELTRFLPHLTEDTIDSGRLLLLDTVMHTFVDVEDPTNLVFTYARTVSDVLATVAPEGEPLDVLNVGGGGFALPRYVAATRPGSTSTVLELDPTLVEVAEDELGLVTGPDLQVEVGDARLTIADQPTDGFDVVIGDAFGGLTVPWHLTTVEFLEEIDRTLEPEGTYVMNLIDFPPLGFARAEVRTLRQVFDNVVVLAPRPRLERTAGGNFILAASDGPIDVGAILDRNSRRGDDEEALVTDEELDRFSGTAPVLTDAYAPVDQLFTPRR